jgi:branched-chain amino acid transport system permease protein
MPGFRVFCSRIFNGLFHRRRLTWGASIDYLFMVIIGGSESLWGAPLGAALVVVLRDQFNDWIPRLTGRAGDFEALVFSLVVIVLLRRAPAGLLPLLTLAVPRGWRKRAGSGIAAVGPDEAAEQAGVPGVRTARGVICISGAAVDDPVEPGHDSRGEVRDGVTERVEGTRGQATELLAVEAVCRDFGGLAAVRDVDLNVRAGEIVALIGPNGAGKTTLFNLISGVLSPSSGHIRLFGAPAGHLPPRRVAALGVARTFQHVKLLPARGVLENIALGGH